VTQPITVPVALEELEALLARLALRERELYMLKGPCRVCRLHYAHEGPHKER
jgi:hypothetical protein